MAIDRDETLRKAEKLLRQGKLEAAIQEYVRLTEEHPRDWNAINALGDLYVRAGDADRAVAQFTRIADFLYEEGFLPKASAVYKKAIKVKPDHEHTLLRLADIAARQGLAAEAKQYLRQLTRQRRERGDARGAAECVLRLGALADADPEAKLEAARAAKLLDNPVRASELLKEAAEAFEKTGRAAEAIEARAEAVQINPADRELRVQLVRAFVDAGRLDRARAFLTAETAGNDPALLLMLARLELAGGGTARARTILSQVVADDPARRADVAALAEELAASGHAGHAYPLLEVGLDAALRAGETNAAIEDLRRFLRHGPHVPALERLVELAVDAGREELVREAQASLADAYLAAGRGAEARVIAEDLIAAEPAVAAHRDRLRRALELLGVENPDAVLAEQLQAKSIVEDGLEVLDLSDLESHRSPPVVAPETAAGAAASGAPPPGHPLHDDRIVLDALEVDLSEALAALSGAPPLPGELDVPSAPGVPELDGVFARMRTEAMREQQVTAARARLASGLAHRDAGRHAEAIADLEAAAQVPMLRFEAASALGRLRLARGELDRAVEWLERAAQAPPPSPDEGLALLYDLADALERLGEDARALALFLEIQAESASYRDVAARVSVLRRQAIRSRNL